MEELSVVSEACNSSTGSSTSLTLVAWFAVVAKVSELGSFDGLQLAAQPESTIHYEMFHARGLYGGYLG